LLHRSGVDIEALRSVLDWGCGAGRILAGWEGLLHSEVRFYGCDVNPAPVAWCRENLPSVEVRQCGPMPPMPYEDATFDLVYGASVYTHLTLPAMLQWTGELARVLRPDGVAVISIHGSHYWPELARISSVGYHSLAEEGFYTYLHADPDATFKGSNYYATFATIAFMRRIFAGFELLHAHRGETDGPTHFASFQDILVFRRS
jgi:SAM-dependent methyltransferase